MESWKLTLYGNWSIIKGKLKQQYGNLTDDDLEYVKGKETELIGRLIKKTGQTQQEFIDWVEKTFKSSDASQTKDKV